METGMTRQAALYYFVNVNGILNFFFGRLTCRNKDWIGNDESHGNFVGSPAIELILD